MALFVALLSGLGLARAEDDSREFAAFRRPAQVAPRETAPLAIEWERLRRAPAGFGPYAMSPADAELLAAARAAQWASAGRLVKSGAANPNARDEAGGCALELAARAGADDVVRLLIQNGAMLERLGEDGFTALGAAAFFGHGSTARLLVRSGADLHALSASGQTPLHLAASTGRVPVIDELLRAGADPLRRNREGDNALDVAANRGQSEAMERLIAAGVDPAESGR
jgi:ankyrin repeat protein